MGCVVVSGGVEEEYGEVIQPVLERYCYSCHGEEKQKGDLDFRVYGDFGRVMESREVWGRVLERVQANEMPPSGSGEMDYGKRQALMKWLRELPKEELDCDQLASDRTQNFYRGHVMSRRLNRHEYVNTVRDLFGVELGVGEGLPRDGAGGEGFDNVGDTLFTSTLAVEKYLAAADEVLGTILPAGGEVSGEWQEVVVARDRLLGDRPGGGVGARDAARGVLERFMPRAYRRGVSGAEVDRMMGLFDRGWERGDGYEGALRLALKGVMVSPHFLFLLEPEPDATGVQPLAAYPLASRLSYFLWASMPDDELLGLAASGELLREDVYVGQVKRMLRDSRAEALGERFAMQWLELERLGGEVRPDAGRYPEFGEGMAEVMLGEVRAYFNYVVREDRSLLELLDSDYVFVNERLAALYGMGGVEGEELRRVEVEDRVRGGVLGMAAVHAVTSYPLRTSPVLRGKWLLEAVLGERVPPPPPNVPSLEAEGETVNAGSLRERLEAHRADPTCAACHDRMDPLGFGMESFDVLGRYRESDGGVAVDASGVLPSGEKFNGPGELKGILMERRDQVMKHLVKKLTGYAYGRPLNKFDECVLRDGMEALKASGYRPGVLIEVIVTSYPFRHRFYANAEQASEGT
jgi:hypothetical protein